MKWWTFEATFWEVVAKFSTVSCNGELTSGCSHWKCKLAKTTQENNCRIPCLGHGERSGQPVTQYDCSENMYIHGK